MLVLGIESSCDETAASVVRSGAHVLSDVIASQANLHEKYGGVVPEIASRAHVQCVTAVIDQALQVAGVTLDQCNAVAATYKPGLIGALLIGLSAAKSLALVTGRALVPVNHVDAHIYAACFENEVRFPLVGMVVSGGHTVLRRYTSWTDVETLGETADDAAGEAFDKVAGILKLGYPGGPAIDKLAASCKGPGTEFPRPFIERDTLDFSFSGLKTAVLYHAQGGSGRSRSIRTMSADETASVALGFQEAVVDVLVAKLRTAVKLTRAKQVVVGGGVAANSMLRRRLEGACREEEVELALPSPRFCLDNGAMIAGLGYHLLRAGKVGALDVDAEPRLDS